MSELMGMGREGEGGENERLCGEEKERKEGGRRGGREKGREGMEGREKEREGEGKKGRQSNVWKASHHGEHNH